MLFIKFIITPKGKLKGICLTGIVFFILFLTWQPKKKKKRIKSHFILLTELIMGASEARFALLQFE